MTERRTTRRYDLSLPIIIRIPSAQAFNMGVAAMIERYDIIRGEARA